MWVEQGRRVRTARAWGGFTKRSHLAEVLDMSESTLQRIEQGKRKAKAPELLGIAKACRVPNEFLDQGWEAIPGWVQPAEEDGDLAAEIAQMGADAEAGFDQVEQDDDQREQPPIEEGDR